MRFYFQFSLSHGSSAMFGGDDSLAGIADSGICAYVEQCFTKDFYLYTRVEVTRIAPAESGVLISFTD